MFPEYLGFNYSISKSDQPALADNPHSFILFFFFMLLWFPEKGADSTGKIDTLNYRAKKCIIIQVKFIYLQNSTHIWTNNKMIAIAFCLSAKQRIGYPVLLQRKNATAIPVNIKKVNMRSTIFQK